MSSWREARRLPRDALFPRFFDLFLKSPGNVFLSFSARAPRMGVRGDGAGHPPCPSRAPVTPKLGNGGHLSPPTLALPGAWALPGGSGLSWQTPALRYPPGLTPHRAVPRGARSSPRHPQTHRSRARTTALLHSQPPGWRRRPKRCKRPRRWDRGRLRFTAFPTQSQDAFGLLLSVPGGC